MPPAKKVLTPGSYGNSKKGNRVTPKKVTPKKVGRPPRLRRRERKRSAGTSIRKKTCRRLCGWCGMRDTVPIGPVR